MRTKGTGQTRTESMVGAVARQQGGGGVDYRGLWGRSQRSVGMLQWSVVDRGKVRRSVVDRGEKTEVDDRPWVGYGGLW